MKTEEIPTHSHTYGWGYGGVRCLFTYKVPPRSEGKEPRTRQCQDFINTDNVLEILNQCIEYYRQTFGNLS